VSKRGDNPSAKSARMERKQQETHRRILEAANSLFMEDSGYEKTTVRKIADCADVSVGTVYLHFRSKAEILAELVHVFQLNFAEEFAAGLSKEKSGLEQLKTFFSMFGRITSDSRAKLFIQLLIRLGSAGLDESIIESAVEPFIAQFIDSLYRILVNGTADGSFPSIKGKERLTATVLFQCIEGLTVFNFDPRQSPGFMSSNFSVDEIFTGFTGFLLEGLGVGKAASIPVNE
jgi:AcrR family transcriptional regulator